LKLREFILESPAIRTIINIVIPIVAGVLSGSFVTEITTPNGLVWSLFYKSASFYALCILTAIIYWYSRLQFIYERDMNRFLDSNYCIAYMRSKCLPEAAERAREQIRLGNGGEFLQAMRELEKILK
jgi:hypothetical protein